MSKPKVYAAVQLDGALLARLEEVCRVSMWTGGGRCPQEVLEAEIPDAEAYVGSSPFTEALMVKAPRLRIIANVGVGYDSVDVAAATRRGILVTNTPEVLTDTTADLAFALLMATARRLGEAERLVRAGEWTAARGSGALLGRDIHHATLGIVGLGRIGSAVARRALGFEMKVLYNDLVGRPELESRYGYRFVDLDTLLAESDFVTLHTPLSPQTRGLIGAAQLARMKPTACLINASRGPVVDEAALIAALQAGRIAGAGLDVFQQEPVDPANPLLRMENVVVVPHVGSATAATRRAMQALGVENALAVMAGKAPLTPVNPELLQGPTRP